MRHLLEKYFHAMPRSDYTLSWYVNFVRISSTFVLVSKCFQNKPTCSVPVSYFYFGDVSNQECATREGDIVVLSSSWLRHPGDFTGSCLVLVLCGYATNPILVFCYDFEAPWIFYQQLQCTVFQILELSCRLYLL